MRKYHRSFQTDPTLTRRRQSSLFTSRELRHPGIRSPWALSTHSRPKPFLEIVVWNFDTYCNNFGIKHELTKHFKGNRFSFKLFWKMLYIKKISKKSDIRSALALSTHSCPKPFLEIVVWNFDTYCNNFWIKHKLNKYFKGNCFSFKLFWKMLYIKRYKKKVRHSFTLGSLNPFPPKMSSWNCCLELWYLRQ